MSHSVVLVSSSAAVLGGYVLWALIAVGRTSSLSDTHYRNGRAWLFPSVLLVALSLVIVPWMEASEDWAALAFMCCGSVLMVALTPTFREEVAGRVHTAAATALLIAGTSWVWLSWGFPWSVALCAILGAIDRDRIVWWLEVGLLVSVYSAIIGIYLS